jgi:ribosomal protein L11 methyltransferase
MERYLCLNMVIDSTETSDALVAFLSAEGFEGFEEEEGRLKAYRPDDEWNRQEVFDELDLRSIAYSLEEIEKTNWNQLWESNFEPVVVDDFVGIRADFHAPIKGVEMELVVTPKMSFGTGHHATTRLMIQQMRQSIKSGDWVLDFGTGTGVLAILAKKMGAAEVIGIDIEDWSIENAIDNAWINEVSDISFHCSNRIEQQGPFNCILANINRNILLDHMSRIGAVLAPGGMILLSGILEEDLLVMDKALGEVGLKRIDYTQEKGWICIQVIQYQ